ncbi:hypothetical protein NQ317_002119 [Molorchus minor]|uniref:Large ribosomal subunit protein eL22 n=1 Tax=Molorchus minor TaxID=1323400 RepID=A0ABQ9JW80_9CUCU|nr:hypothetical protein NQ317_002119 [Molorchus minor]
MAPTKAAVPATKPQAKKPQIRGKGLKKKKVALKFVIDCTHPVEDSILDVGNFEQYLKTRIKINGKTGYLKYLTKKYLKKNNLRDWLRVVASGKDSYELRYFQINSQEDDDEEDNE